MNLNKVTIAGNLTRDPESQFTQKGTCVCKFGVAVNRKWTSDSGEKKEEVTFIDVTAFGKTGENIAQYFRKGRAIYVEGRLKLDEWNDKATGQKRTKLGVIAETFQFVGGKSDSQPQQSAKPAPQPTEAEPSDATPADDVPF